jgi:hypothetical protein
MTPQEYVEENWETFNQGGGNSVEDMTRLIAAWDSSELRRQSQELEARTELIMGVHPSRYSLCLELKEGLEKRGHWFPRKWVGPDIITAVFMAIEKEHAAALRSTTRGKGA